MYRAVMLFLALMFSPAVALAQQPCTTDARQVVNELYRHMLERGADAGSAGWAQQLESGRATVRDVVRQIAKSDEHTQRFWRQEAGEDAPYLRAVGTLYRHILGRQPDAAGARSWADQGARSGVSAIVDQIAGSREYDNQFGDWGVPGSGGMRFCASNSQTATGRPANDREARRAERFDSLDINNNGRIELREWDGTAVAFDRLDANNDNVLSRAEMAAVVGTSGR